MSFADEVGVHPAIVAALRFFGCIVKKALLQEAWNVVLTLASHLARIVLRSCMERQVFILRVDVVQRAAAVR